MENGDSGQTATKPCIQCALLIPLEAQLCTKCDSHQNWRRFLKLSDNFLALFVALISVMTAGLPIIVKSLSAPKSEIGFSQIRYQGSEISMMVSNLGDKAGIIDIDDFSSGYLPGTSKSFGFQLGDPEKAVVQPGSSQQVIIKYRFEASSDTALELVERYRKLSSLERTSFFQNSTLVMLVKQPNGEPLKFKLTPGFDSYFQSLEAFGRKCRLEETSLKNSAPKRLSKSELANWRKSELMAKRCYDWDAGAIKKFDDMSNKKTMEKILNDIEL